MGCAPAKADSGGKRTPELLDEYVLGDVVGQGTYGIVYRCTKKGVGQDGAVKMIDKVESQMDDIKREVRMLQKLAHPRVMRLQDVYFEKMFVCIVTDLYMGGDLIKGILFHLEKRGPVPIDSIPNTARQMSEAIAFLHSMDCVHRDIKGDNFLMDRKDVVDPGMQLFLSDFGMAIELPPAKKRLSRRCGTRTYWSPEVYASDYGTKSDVWAMGIVIYGMIKGTFPFKNEEETKNKVLSLPARVTDPCRKFVDGCLDKDEKQRFEAKTALKHEWLTVGAPGGGDTQGGPDAVQQASSVVFTEKGIMEKGPTVGVDERRRELVERLQMGQALKGAKTVDDRFTDLGKPSFQVVYPGQRNMYMEWWSSTKCKEQGLSMSEKESPNGAQSKESERTAYAEVVRKMLANYSIATENWGKGGKKTVEEFAEELRMGASRLMLDATQHQLMVRVVDVVLVKVFANVDGHRKYLIQVGETAEGKEKKHVNQLPGMLKEGHENFHQVAMRVVRDQLNMTECNVVFSRTTESFDEEVESLSYPGMKTVYRKTLYQGEVTTKDATLLQQVGISGGKEHTAVDANKMTRNFKWMTERQATDLKVKMATPEAGNQISALVQVPVGFDQEQLQAFLHSGNVDVSKFGTEKYGTLDEFAEELMKGEATLERQADGSILRVVDIILLNLAKRGTGEILVEVSETVRGSTDVTPLNRLPAVKRRDDENQFCAAQRLLTKFMKVDVDQVVLHPEEVHVMDSAVQDSNAYPGIKSKYRKRIINGEFAALAPGADSTI